MNTPQDIYEYVVRSGAESDFLSAILLQKDGFSIAELPDAVFVPGQGSCVLKSAQYRLNQTITDEDICAAAAKGQYITAFLSRLGEQYQLHFLVHDCQAQEKAACEEEIARRVVRYMILKTIVALRLDTWKKVDAYLGG